MTKNSETLADFTEYCKDHPDQRFWQALGNWSGYPFIFVGDLKPKLPEGVEVFPELTEENLIGIVKSLGLEDTFYKEGK